MKLSDLFTQLKAAGDVTSFTLYLAAPDKDGTDVDLASVGRVEIDHNEGVVRLYPAEPATDVDTDLETDEPEPYLGMVLSQLPMDAIGENDLNLVVEVPLIRDDGGDDEVSLEDVAEIVIGKSSEEVWFLARPAEDFGADLLPT